MIKNFNNFINESTEGLSKYNPKIDYTNLKLDATQQDIIDLCKKADMMGVKSVCIRPDKVYLAYRELADSKVLVCTVISFPEGTNSTNDKMRETAKALKDGADEIDMILNYQLMKKSGSQVVDILLNDVESLVRMCHAKTNKNGEKVILKVIVESGLLTAAETENATYICLDAGADFIKTSTGMVAVGAELDKVKIMRKIIDQNGSKMKIKASGGVNKANIDSFAPLVDRFGMGAKAVEELNNLGKNTENY